MKKLIIVFVSLLLTLSLFAGDNGEMEKTAIKKVIESAYMDGLGNVGDVEAVKKGFHPGFHITGINNSMDDTWKYPIHSWCLSVEKKKKEGKYPPKEKITFEFPLIDVTYHAAMVKVKYLKAGKLAYTDYLSLYKFKEGWKIVGKIYFEHKKKKK